MVEKIVSGGQSGVDRAALDAAMKLGLACGGWCPKGRLAEGRPIPRRYPLTETPTREYAERTEWNVRDSDGTLVLTWGAPTNGTALTIGLARRQHKPCHIVDLKEILEQLDVVEWTREHSVRVLNVAGPRASHHGNVYPASLAFLLELFPQIAATR